MTDYADKLLTQDLGPEIPRKKKDYAEMLTSGEIKSPGSSVTEKQGFISKTISNIPESALEYGKAIATPILHPIKTVSDLGNVFKGIDVKLRKLWDPNITPEEEKFEPYAEGAWDFIKDRYGGLENLKKTVSEDPVGFMGDLSTFLTGGGGIVGKIGPISKVGQTVSKIGQIAEPISGAIKAVSMPAKLIPKGMISKVYESAAKFSTKLTPKERSKLVSTALEHEIGISARGVDKVKGIIEGLNQEITTKIDVATTQGRTIQIQDLFGGFNKLEDEARLSGRPMENLQTIKKIKKSIQKANEDIGREALTPKEAQVLKQTIYKDLENYYSSVRESPISVKAQKQVAKNAKEALEKFIPEIKMLNRQEGALIELSEALEKAANRITNRDIIGIGVPIKGTVGGIVGGWKGAAGGIAIGLFDTPGIKSKLAIVLNRLKEKGIKVRPTSTAIRLGLFQVGREEGEPTD